MTTKTYVILYTFSQGMRCTFLALLLWILMLLSWALWRSPRYQCTSPTECRLSSGNHCWLYANHFWRLQIFGFDLWHFTKTMQSWYNCAIIHFAVGIQKGAHWCCEGLGVIFQLICETPAELMEHCLQVLSRWCAFRKNTKHQLHLIKWFWPLLKKKCNTVNRNYWQIKFVLLFNIFFHIFTDPRC